MFQNYIYFIMLIVSNILFSNEILRDAQIFWSSDRNEKILLDWEIRTFFSWDEHSGYYSPVYHHDIVIPPLLEVELQQNIIHVTGINLKPDKLDELVNGNILRVNSTLGNKIVALSRLVGGEKKEAKLNIVLVNNPKSQVIYHRKCNEGEFKRIKLSFSPLNLDTLFVSCSKNGLSLQFDLFSNFSEYKLTSTQEKIEIQKISDEHIKINIYSNHNLENEFLQKNILGHFEYDAGLVGDVFLQIEKNINSRFEVTDSEKTTLANQAISELQFKSEYSLATGISSYGIFFMPTFRLDWVWACYQFEFFAPASFIFDTNDKKRYYYFNNYFWSKIASHSQLEFLAGISAGYGRVQDLEKKYFISVGPQVGVKFKDMLLISNMNISTSEVSRFFTKIIFNESDKVISYFISYDMLNIKDISFEDKILTGGIQLKW